MITQFVQKVQYFTENGSSLLLYQQNLLLTEFYILLTVHPGMTLGK